MRLFSFYCLLVANLFGCIDDGESWFHQEDCLVDLDLREPYYHECIDLALEEKIQKFGLSYLVDYVNKLIHLYNQFQICEQNPSYKAQYAAVCRSLQPMAQLIAQGESRFIQVSSHLQPLENQEGVVYEQDSLGAWIDQIRVAILEHLTSEEACFLILPS